MFEIHYLVPTAEGGFNEKVLIDEGKNFIEGRLSQCRIHGYEVLKNPVCKHCKRFGRDCHGEANFRMTALDCPGYEEAGV